MTSFYNEVYGKYIMNTPQKVDMNRIMEWGNKLPMIRRGKIENSQNNKSGSEPSNIFESITYGMTYVGVDYSTQLKCHVDFFNDKIEGFNFAMTVYFHHKHKRTGKYVRIAIIGYMRRVVSDFYDRFENRKKLMENMILYYENHYSMELFW